MNLETKEQAPVPGAAENIVFEAEGFFKRHKGRIVGGVVILAAVAAVVAGWWWNREQEAVAAQAALAAVKSAEELLKVADEHSGTAAAAEALMRHGDMSLQNGDWEPAARSFNRFIELFPGHVLSANALMGLGAAYEEMQRFPDAENSYRRVFEEHRKSHRAAEARLAFGELLAAQGRDREAREAFETLISVNPESVWVQDARRALEELGRKSGAPAQSVTPAAAPAQPPPSAKQPAAAPAPAPAKP